MKSQSDCNTNRHKQRLREKDGIYLSMQEMASGGSAVTKIVQTILHSLSADCQTSGQIRSVTQSLV